MTWLRQVRPMLYVLGVALVVGSLLGARALTNANGKSKGNGNGEQKTANPAGINGRLTGPIVLGTVDSQSIPVPYILPPVLQSGTIAHVFVDGNQVVKAGDPLYEFDTTLQKISLERARAAVATAKTKVAEAEEGVKKHARMIELAKQSVLQAEEIRDLRKKTYDQVKSNLEEFWKGQKKVDTKPYSDAEIAQKLKDDDKVLKAYADYVAAFREHAFKEAERAALEAADPKVFVHVAEAGVKQAEEEEKGALKVIELCTVRAKSAGTVERVTIGPGTTLGMSTREPALWLIPSGKRIVRAEVEADFAHKVGPEIEGKQVTVFDNTNTKLTYTGTVLHVGKTFLPKRSAGESILTNETRVLEAVIEIADPEPADKPPLRVGQRVRVGLGQ